MVRADTIRNTKLILAEPVQRQETDTIWRFVFYDSVTGEEHEIMVATDNDELGE